MMWVIPCRYDPIVFDSVAGIRTHFPDDTICLVDSCSSDTSYLDDIDVDHVITGNKHYAWGAFAAAYNRYQADRWALIHDSLVVQSHWDPGDFQTVRWFVEPGPPVDQWDFVHDNLVRCGFDVDLHQYNGIFGPMLWCTDAVMNDFEAHGLWTIQPANNIEASALERISGIAAEQMGYDPTADALQGHMGDFYGKYQGDKVIKHHRARA